MISSLRQKRAEREGHTSSMALNGGLDDSLLVRCNEAKSPRAPCLHLNYIGSVDLVSAGLLGLAYLTRSWDCTFPKCREGHFHFYESYQHYAQRTKSPVDTDMSIVSREGNTVPKRTSKAHSEHSTKSVRPSATASKTIQVYAICGHPSGRTTKPRSCGKSVRCTWRWKRGGPGETNWGLGWGIRRRRTWHGTYARRLEALPDGMHSQGGWEGRIRAMSLKGTRGKWGEGGRETKQQRTAREIAEASGERRRRRRRRCTGRGWLQARVGRQPPTLRSHREIACCRSSDNHVKFLPHLWFL